jgi:hypothetical protein
MEGKTQIVVQVTSMTCGNGEQVIGRSPLAGILASLAFAIARNYPAQGEITGPISSVMVP